MHAAATSAAQPCNVMRDRCIIVRCHFDHHATSAHGQRATAGHHWRNGLRAIAANGRATCATFARSGAQRRATICASISPRPITSRPLFAQPKAVKKYADLFLEVRSSISYISPSSATSSPSSSSSPFEFSSSFGDPRQSDHDLVSSTLVRRSRLVRPKPWLDVEIARCSAAWVSSPLLALRACTVAHGWGCGWFRWNCMDLRVVQQTGLRPGWPEQSVRKAESGCRARVWAAAHAWVRVVFGPGGSIEPIKHAEPLGSLGLNGAGDDPAEYITIGSEDL
ncbi:hypothetical protein F511_12237 [Dorcoceras hygrometricum]|uniref:Uncharacterized protein n=1 Tax=Dorcoceras hygrometricum TaxID=472368 RepID=A0A2Z7AY01_9LAMI|nr:hypothetical protein F511_12237 [Dorcoceras hygrometricum]